MLGVKCMQRESRFMHGSDDVPGREAKLREWLSIREDGSTKFLIIVARCPNTVREIERFRKKTVKIGGQDVPDDKGDRRANTHAVETVEYGAAHGLPYVKPPALNNGMSTVKWIKEQRSARAAQRRAKHGPVTNSIVLGPRGSR